MAADFLKLLASKQYGRAREEFASLVDQLVDFNGCLQPQDEQQLHLQPTPAYTKLRKLFRNREAVDGLLDLLVCNDSLVSAVSMLHALGRITAAPGFAAPIASCSRAVDAMQRVGTLLYSCALSKLSHTPVPSDEERLSLSGCLSYLTLLDDLLKVSPEFTEQAFRCNLFSLTMSIFPFPGSPPRKRELERASRYSLMAVAVKAAVSRFTDTPSKLERVAQSEAISSLLLWLTNFADFLAAMLQQFLKVPEVKERLQAVGGSLFNSSTALLWQSPNLVDDDRFQRSVRSLQGLKRYLSEGGRVSAKTFLNNVRSRQNKGDKPRPCPTDMPTENALLQLADPNLSNEMMDRCVSVLSAAPTAEIETLLEKGCAELLSNVLVARISKGLQAKSLQEKAQDLLAQTVFFLGTIIAVGLSKEELLAEDVDKIGSTLLLLLTPAFSVLNSSGQANFLEVLIYCFNGGTDSPSTWQEYTRALAGVVIRRDLNRNALGLGWHFMAVLFGCYESFDETIVFAAREDIELKPKKLTAVGSVFSFLTTEDVNQVVGQALQRLSEASWNSVHPCDRMESVAAVVLQCAIECSACLDLAKTRIGPLIQLLKRESSRLLEDFRTHFEDVPENTLPQTDLATEEQLMQELFLFGSLLKIFKMAHESCQSESQTREKFLLETAGYGGIIACKAFLGIARSVRRAVAEDGNSADEAAEAFEEEYKIASEIWAAYAMQFALKECSNTACLDGVVETSRKTFKACSACGAAYYCSRSCQMTHWKNGHKAECKKAEGS